LAQVAADFNGVNLLSLQRQVQQSTPQDIGVAVNECDLRQFLSVFQKRGGVINQGGDQRLLLAVLQLADRLANAEGR
jgi:hypothetical protein